MALAWPTKDPNDVLDYQIDWSDWLLTDTISTSAWTVPSGITKNSDSHTDAATTIWLSAGTAGDSYTLTNRIVTAGGRTSDQSVKIKVKEN